METEQPKLDEIHLAAWRAFVNAHAAVIDHIERELSAAGQISLAWYDVLVALWEAPDHRLRLNELARTIVLSRSGLTRLIDRLEAAGLLRREPSVDDLRGFYAVITPAGREAQLRAWPVYARGIATHFAQYLTDADAVLIAERLDRVDAEARGSS